MTKLLTAFRTFFGEHSGHWLGRFGDYPEAGPQLILQAYLHRVVNGGRPHRAGVRGWGEAGTDLLVLWPREAGQPSDLWERFVVECKVLRDTDRKSLAGTVERGVEQTLGYMAKCGADEGHLVVITAAPVRRSAGTARARRSTGTAGAGRMEAVAGKTGAGWWSGRCRAWARHRAAAAGTTAPSADIDRPTGGVERWCVERCWRWRVA